MLIDDDRDYCHILTDYLKKTGTFLVCITNEMDLRRIELNQYDVILVDHTLGWTFGDILIDDMFSKTKASFALISTYAPNLFNIENTVSPRISDMFGKYQLSKIDEFIDYVGQKKLILGHDTNPHSNKEEEKKA